MKVNGLLVPEGAIASLCRRSRIGRLALFGSALHGALRADSDLDVLVEFEDGHTPGFAFFRVQADLSRILGRQVDLNTPQFLSAAIREEIQAEAEVLFGPA